MPISLLICDDSLVARKQVAKSLPQDWDIDIHFAKDGEDALDQITTGKGQVLLLDLNMPVLDGYGTLAAIKANSYSTKTIVISGDIQPEAHRRVKELGALDFVQKPVDGQKLKAVLEKHGLISASSIPEEEQSDLPALIRDCYQEVTNVAMGQAGDHLARILNVFVKLPIPNVNLIEVPELHMMLSDIELSNQVSAVCQGFVGGGISGEALCILTDSSFGDVAKILNIEDTVDDQIQLEMLMDAASILIGTCLHGLAEQMDLKIRQHQPIVLGQHRCIDELIHTNQQRWKKTLAIELSYGIEGYDVQCDLLLLFSEDSLEVMERKLMHLMEEAA